jgi:hypothetical protein
MHYSIDCTYDVPIYCLFAFDYTRVPDATGSDLVKAVVRFPSYIASKPGLAHENTIQLEHKVLLPRG